ncbi:MAG: hypothetical protein R6U19_03745 [Bacteroidales bacterium]
MKLKLILFVAIICCLTGCSDWTVLSPTDGELTVEVLSVEITFDYDEGEIILFNKNWNIARIQISRRESNMEYIEVIDKRVFGRITVTETAYFSAGDKIKITVEVKDENDDDITRNMYLELGEE